MQLTLAPSGNFRLWVSDDVSVDIPVTGAGAHIIAQILQGASAGLTKLGHSGAPTQFQVDELVAAYYKKLVAPIILPVNLPELDL